MPNSHLWLRLSAGPRCISVPGGHALVGPTGFFVREIQLPVGTAVVPQFRRGKNEVALRGTVSTSYPDLGLSVEFNEKSGPAVEKLTVLLAAWGRTHCGSNLN
jgi:hypothetical protein